MPVGRAVVKTDLRGKSVGSGPGPQDRKCFARANQAKSPGPGVAFRVGIPAPVLLPSGVHCTQPESTAQRQQLSPERKPAFCVLSVSSPGPKKTKRQVFRALIFLSG